MSEIAHIPVLLEVALTNLKIQRKGTYIDCTLGLGGHALEIVKRNSEAELIGFDIDEQSLLRSKEKFKPFSDRVKLDHSDFRYLLELKIHFSLIKGILLDLGISSFQLDSPERGFSYNQDGPLDMRMDHRNKTTAAKIINKYSENKLTQIFREYGELKQSSRLASAIITKRKIRKIETTSQLFNIVEEVCRWRYQKGKTHPAAKIFQAIRIEVNQELKNIAGFLEKIINKVPKHTRIVAISFHSLEDRIIKQTFNKLAVSNGTTSVIKVLTKRPIIATEEEINRNFRARSAKLRTAEKL